MTRLRLAAPPPLVAVLLLAGLHEPARNPKSASLAVVRCRSIPTGDLYVCVRFVGCAATAGAWIVGHSFAGDASRFRCASASARAGDFGLADRIERILPSDRSAVAD